MTLMGGIDATIDREDAQEEEIRADVRRACSTYGPAGHFIPCMTYGLAGTIYPKTDEIIADEIEAYNREIYHIYKAEAETSFSASASFLCSPCDFPRSAALHPSFGHAILMSY